MISNHLKFYLITILFITSCSGTKKNNIIYPSDVIPIFNHWNLILGNGSNIGQAVDFNDSNFFYVKKENDKNWIVFKTPNAGNTHGTSNNTRTELAQLKKWSAKDNSKLEASLKVTNVANTGDARVAASYSVVVGQIHSADGHENEPLKIFYKKFPGHKKGSVFWNYEINTKGNDNSKRWDYSYPVWGYDFSVVGNEKNSYPEEPNDGIELDELFSYEIQVNNGIMTLIFSSEGHETKKFTKNLIKSEYSDLSKTPDQVKNLFYPIGQNGIERQSAYADEGLFFKMGSYNQTNGKDPSVNRVWCSGAETHGGDLQKQYEDGNYAEVWFKSASIDISEKSISNMDYFLSNDGLSSKIVFPSQVIPFMDKFKILLGDGSNEENLVDYYDKDFFYTVIDGNRRWVAYKAPNSGVTSKNSNNTRTELHQKNEWTPEKGGRLTGTCKVMQVSVSGDARVPASFSTVVGQIHSGEGHENEPLKIFYKKFPGHKKGSVFWNYEINTSGDDNSGRWDISSPVWGYDFSVVGKDRNDYPDEPMDGIEIGEEFSYEINVYKGIMYLTFQSENHETKTFTKNLISSEYTNKENFPDQVKKLFLPIGQDGVEKANAYAGELNYFKQGAYNQTNGKNPINNMVWATGAETLQGDIEKQYLNGYFTEVWFREAYVGEGLPPKKNK